MKFDMQNKTVEKIYLYIKRKPSFSIPEYLSIIPSRIRNAYMGAIDTSYYGWKVGHLIKFIFINPTFLFSGKINIYAQM